MDCVRWKKVSITGMQGVGFVTDAQFQLAAQNPMRLIFGMRMRAVFCSRWVSPLEDAVTFALQARLQLLFIRPRLFTPSSDLNTHNTDCVGTTCVSGWVSPFYRGEGRRLDLGRRHDAG